MDTSRKCLSCIAQMRPIAFLCPTWTQKSAGLGPCPLVVSRLDTKHDLDASFPYLAMTYILCPCVPAEYSAHTSATVGRTLGASGSTPVSFHFAGTLPLLASV